MANPHMSVAIDDDLPRTFRRDKAEKAAREAAEAAAAAERDRAEALRTEPSRRSSEADMPRIFEQRGTGTPQIDTPPPYASAPFRDFQDEPQPAVVKALRIPFFHLMLFCLKLTLAAIPALILLGAILYGMGQVLKMYLPWLVQTEILIRFPK